MDKSKKIIHYVKHKMTGAVIPVIVKKIIKDNIIEDYFEYNENRKGFTLKMLENRWSKPQEEIITILKKYQVPGHLNNKNILKQNGNYPINFAIFWQEYIHAIEKKDKIPHKKLKSRLFENEGKF